MRPVTVPYRKKSYHSIAVPMVLATTARRSWVRCSCSDNAAGIVVMRSGEKVRALVPRWCEPASLSIVSVTYQIDPVRHRIYITMADRVDGAEVLQAQRRMAAEPAFDPTLARLIDLTAVAVFDVSADVVRTLAAQSVTAHDTRRAIVAKQALLVGLSRMFQILNEEKPGEVRIFEQVEAAERWLDAR